MEEVEIIKSCLSSNIGDVCLLTGNGYFFSVLGIMFLILMGVLLIMLIIFMFQEIKEHFKDVKEMKYKLENLEVELSLKNAENKGK